MNNTDRLMNHVPDKTILIRISDESTLLLPTYLYRKIVVTNEFMYTQFIYAEQIHNFVIKNASFIEQEK